MSTLKACGLSRYPKAVSAWFISPGSMLPERSRSKVMKVCCNQVGKETRSMAAGHTFAHHYHSGAHTHKRMHTQTHTQVPHMPLADHCPQLLELVESHFPTVVSLPSFKDQTHPPSITMSTPTPHPPPRSAPINHHTSLTPPQSPRLPPSPSITTPPLPTHV